MFSTRLRSRLILTASLPALLLGCGVFGPPKPDNCGGCMSEQAKTTLDLGYSETGQLATSFRGLWRIDDKPSWLTVSSYSGTGAKPLALSLGVNRNVGVPVAADRQEMTGTIKVSWQPPSGGDWLSAEWPVQAKRYSLSGQIKWPAITGADAHSQADDARPADAGGSSQIIVKYRSAGVAQALGELGAQGLTVPQLSALSANERPLAQASAAVWQRAGVTEASAKLGDRTVVLSSEQPQVLLKALEADPAVEYAVPSARLSTQTVQAPADPQAEGQAALAQPVVPTDQYASLQWGYRTLGYGAVWRDMESGAYSRPVTVAVLDSGVRYDHPDLQGKLLTGDQGALDVLAYHAGSDTVAAYDNGDGDGPDRDPTDPPFPGRSAQSHGTHVSGIIAARWGEQAVSNPKWSRSGVVGASYRAPVSVLPVRVIDAKGGAEVSDVAAGIRYAAGQSVTLGDQTYRLAAPAQVINLSLGGPIGIKEAQPMCDAIAEARAAGVVVVAASGNYYNDVTVYPAACAGAIGVGSVTLSGASAPRHSEFSNRFAEVALSAPGGTGLGTTFNGGTLNGQPAPDQIFSTDWDYAVNEPRYTFQAGTSQAAPQVSALAALLLSKGVTTGPADTEQRMFGTATDLGAKGRDHFFGYGMINPAAALKAPAVSSGFGFSLQADDGRAYQPALNAEGRFTAYLGSGNYTVRAGRDRNGNALPGEAGETPVQASATLSEQKPEVTLPTLQVP